MDIKKFISLPQLTTALRIEGVRGREFELSILEWLKELKRKRWKPQASQFAPDYIYRTRLHMALR